MRPLLTARHWLGADDAERAVRAGFTRHLAKAVDAQVLADVISTLVPS